jgi:FAD/FMN-containing dehydrogenase/Fe-S oxidoreductase
MLGPDPLSAETATVGGAIGTDASGPRSPAFGRMSDHVRRLTLALADGSIVEVDRRTPIPPPAPIDDKGQPLPRTALDRIAEGLAGILSWGTRGLDTDGERIPWKLGGLNLAGVRSGNALDLPKLIAGSEGTLAAVLEAELALVPIPATRITLIASFVSLDAAARIAPRLAGPGLAACELMDRRLISLLPGVDSRYAPWFPNRAEAALLMEVAGDVPRDVDDEVARIVETLLESRFLFGPPVRLTGADERAFAWRARTAAVHRLVRESRPAAPIPLIDSLAVPPDRLAELIRELQEILRRHEFPSAMVARGTEGIVDVRPLVELADPAQAARLESLSDAACDAVMKLGGSFHAVHGAGLVRGRYLRRQFPRQVPVFQRIKTLFDPDNTLNPGRLTDAADPFPWQSLRVPVPAPAERVELPLLLLWPGVSATAEAAACNGCGGCRSVASGGRMCPVHRAEGGEESAPRSKGALLRQLAAGQVPASLLPTDELRDLAAHCVSCRMCKVECPAGVDVPKLMLEVRAANVADRGLGRTERMIASLPRWSARLARIHRVSNTLLASPALRWLAERWFGLSRRRRLPRFQGPSFLLRARQRSWTVRPRSATRKPRVALFVDTFTNHCDPELGVLAGRMLERLGRLVYVPPHQVPSEIPALEVGDLDTARQALKANLEVFAELVREGYDIVTLEPASALLFREDAKNLIVDPDFDLIAAHTFEWSEYLDRVDPAEIPTPDRLQPLPLTVGLHDPCHQRALRFGRPATPAHGVNGSANRPRVDPARGYSMEAAPPVPDWLARIPGLNAMPLDHGCSGMAGAWGMRADRFQASLRAGAEVIDRFLRPDLRLGAAQCPSCRIQLEQASGKRFQHPAALLAISMGLSDLPADRLRDPRGRLIES